MIFAAAIRHDNHVYTLPSPARHHTIMRVYPDCKHGVQGFLDTNAGFVERIQAADIANSEGQLKNGLFAPPNLFSEDLWKCDYLISYPKSLVHGTLHIGKLGMP